MTTAEVLSFPFRSGDPLQPPAEYARLRAEGPLTRVTLPTGDPAWLVTRHAEVRAVLSDARFSREAITAPGAPRLLPIAQGSKSIFVMDPPEHTRLRRLVSRAFSTRRIAALRPRVQQLTDDLLDAMAGGPQPADLMTGLAQPLPITVICEMLGVPYADVAQFRAWTDIMLSFDANRRDEVLAARNHLNDYLTELIEQKRRNPTEDLLMVLIGAREEGDGLSQEELLAFGYTLLGAGYHATTSGIAHSVLMLLRAPAQWERLRADRSLVPSAVEELLRLSQAGGGLGALRIALADVEVGGVLVRAGEAILPSINAANRDPEAFAEPDVLDVSRKPNLHVAFGYGIHHCLGAQLGRMELEIALGGLLDRMPKLALAGSESELHWSAGVAFSRPAELPVTW
ncbi:cytochrome P450 [Paractinoplanes ferrugineus]|uniref:Cytochrome P450 n=1 Tax=Paractinoplanes ferrugineus TaxID=113564 RepID=A0A919MBJ4_9ACTN|nr:cytochrome P450 [Actinoplanes ferrugineus]GIE13726.1 cytochrome P450 [Actinoplanes ferrugineus]